MRNLALLVFSFVAFSAHALTNVDLYQTEVVIDQEQDNADAKARVEGMKEVIVRASGDESAVTNDVVKKALKQNSQYLTQISYANDGQDKTIRMGFSAPHIRSLLSQAKLSFWPQSRANVLVWLVEESSYDRNIVWEHSSSAFLSQLKDNANRRGLPLTLPVGDFDDITGVAVSDLWGGFVKPISAASQRYPTDAVLIVRASDNSVRWTLYDQKPNAMSNQTMSPVSGSNSGSDAAAKMVNQISNYYAKKSAVVVASESSESVKAQFTNINNALDFFQLESKLNSLSSVASLDILKIQGSDVTFNVHLLASEDDFSQEVSRMGQVVQLENKSVAELNGALPLLPNIDTPQSNSTSVETNNTAATGADSVPLGAEDTDTVATIEPVVVEDVKPDVEPIVPLEQVLVFEWQGHTMTAPQPLDDAQQADGISSDSAESSAGGAKESDELMSFESDNS